VLFLVPEYGHREPARVVRVSVEVEVLDVLGLESGLASAPGKGSADAKGQPSVPIRGETTVKAIYCT
jgi:hypothetical protein